MRKKFKQDRKRQTKDYGYCGTTPKRPLSCPQKQDFAPHQRHLNLCFLGAGVVVVAVVVAVHYCRMEARKEEVVMQGYGYLGRNLKTLTIVGVTLSMKRWRIGWSRQKRKPRMWTSTWSRTVVDTVGPLAVSSHRPHQWGPDNRYILFSALEYLRNEELYVIGHYDRYC